MVVIKSIPIKQRLVKRNSVSCGIRMTHHSAAPQLSVCYSIVCIGQRDRILLSRLMLITSKTVILPHFLHFDSTWPRVSSYTTIALCLQYGHLIYRGSWLAIAFRARIIFCCISAEGSVILISHLLMATPPMDRDIHNPFSGSDSPVVPSG